MSRGRPTFDIDTMSWEWEPPHLRDYRSDSNHDPYEELADRERYAERHKRIRRDGIPTGEEIWFGEQKQGEEG